MDFSVAKRNQFPVTIDMRVHMTLGFPDEVFTPVEKLLRLNQ